MRAVPPFCVEFVKNFEGLRLVGAHDPADAPNIITIGWGHTADEGPPVPKVGMQITRKDADAILLEDLQRHAATVESLVKVPINDSQFAALVSFAFNLGNEALRMSTLLARVNAKRFLDAAYIEFRKWDHANGKELPGLLRRRLSEAQLFCGFPDPIVQHVDLPKFRKSREPLTDSEKASLKR